MRDAVTGDVGMRDQWNGKKGILAGLAVFLGFMLACTVAAKGIYSNGLPRVQLCQPEKKSLHYEIDGRGAVLPGMTYGVYVPQGVRVHTVCVRAGEQIREGDALLELDAADLEVRIQEAASERNYLKAQLDDLTSGADRQSREQKRLAERLQEDYEGLLAQQDLLVENAKLAVESARIRMAEIGEDPSGTDLAYKTAEKELELAENALEQARLNRIEALQNWSRSLEDAQDGLLQATAERVRLSGELAAQDRTLEEFKQLQEDGGKVFAKEAGTVLECMTKTGARTGDGACILYTKSGDGVEITLPETDGQRLSIGDVVSLQCKTVIGENRRFEGTVAYQESENGQRTLRIEADVSGLPAGQTVSMNYSCNSESYETVIPDSALYRDSFSAWVYTVEEVEGILGTEHRIRRMPVTVLEENGQYAAVTGAGLTQESRIVERSNQELAENAAVRVMEE
ncbi:MAG: hypothetical protein NC399_01560 [Muribaculum sp.]|nr:hypothetical protein [Muribaculum sp.]